MYKSEKGITMVMLVIMIIVMLILAGILLYEGTSLIQAKARTIADKVDFGEAQYIGTEITEEDLINKLKIPEGATVYKLSQSNLDEIDVDVSGDNMYAVDYDNEEIYYIEGITDKDNNICYSLTDMSKLSLTEIE